MPNKIARVTFLFLVLCSLSVEAAMHIRSISFKGNFITQESLLLREMYVTEGDVLDLKNIEKSVQGIMDLGLYKSVRYYLAVDYVYANENAVDLVIELEEKFYLLILPQVRINEDETHLGVQIRWDNVFGLNHEMRFMVEDRGTTDGVNERRQRIRYKYPNVNGSNYELNIKLININDVDEIDDLTSVDRIDRNLNAGLFKWLNPTGRNRGWFAGIGVNYRKRENKVVFGDLSDNKMDAMVIEMQYGYKDLHEYAYNRGGKAFGYNLGVAHHGLGSDSEFFNHQLYYRSYYRFESRPHDNLNVQTLFSHSTENILDNEAYSLGSNQGLRGYDSNSIVGNTMLLLNIEYLTPSTIAPSLRYVYFIDMGNTYDDISEIKNGHLKTGVGMGLRWKIPMFVRVDLRFDIAYATKEDDYRISFGFRHIF